jgi:hypothetical protein
VILTVAVAVGSAVGGCGLLSTGVYLIHVYFLKPRGAMIVPSATLTDSRLAV